MDYREILLLGDGSRHFPARLDLAVAVAQKHQAHLTCLFPLPALRLRPQGQSLEPAAAQAELLFRQKTKAARLAGRWLCEPTYGPEAAIGLAARHAQVSDLLILGQTDPDGADDHLPADLPERLVLCSGRPVLIVPYAGHFADVGNRVLVGWRGGRESVRAVNDALPLLCKARLVHVLTINPPAGEEAAETLFAAELCDHLARHGVDASPEQVLAGSLSVGDSLLNRLTDEAADLLVMGVYAQTRRGSLTLGEVGRHLLRHMTVPVLMSH